MIPPRVLPRPYPRQLQDHFIRLSDELQWRRGFAADKATWEERRPRVREALLAALGGLPERTPLAARIVETLPRDGYRIEKLVYESRPGFLVTGAVYVPDAPGPHPAVFCPHGHYQEGRYAEPVQRRCIGFARRGYVTLTIDKVGYNDRAAQDHRGRQTFLAGLPVQGFQVWDNMRGLDYLQSRPDVEPTRLGVTGGSGGGNQTMYLAALDERVTAAAPVCSVELGECYMHKTFCTCETIPGLRRFADLVDICSLIAPRPLLLLHGLLDTGFRIDSGRKAFLRLKTLYEALGAGELVDQVTALVPHGYEIEFREAAYAWFDRHLKGLERREPERPDAVLEPPATLRCLPAGLPEGAATLTGYYRAATASFPPRPPLADADAWRREAERLRERLAEVLGGWPTAGDLRPRVTAIEAIELPEGRVTVESFYLFTEPDVIVPGVWYRPAGGAPHPTVIRFGRAGRLEVTEARLTADLTLGRGVVTVDLRGQGETRAGEWGPSEHQGWLSSVTLGRPLVGMRVWDLLRLADHLLARPEVDRLELAAGGTLYEGFVALLAAALDPRFAAVEVAETLATFKDQADFGPIPSPGQNAIVPGFLKVADIADLLALIAPRPVHLGRLVDALGQPCAAPAWFLDRRREVERLLGGGSVEVGR